MNHSVASRSGDRPLSTEAGLEQLGRYQLVERIGVDEGVETLLARQQGMARFQKTVVLRRVWAQPTTDPSFIEAFRQAATTATLLRHPNIAQILEVGEEATQHYFAVEFVDGLTLWDLARRFWHRGRPLPMELACIAVADAAAGLQYAHSLCGADGLPLALVHGRLTPRSLMTTKGGVTTLLGFGRVPTGPSAAQLPFAAPEQGLGNIDRRADVYALGATLYWLLTGRPPVDADGVRKPPRPRLLNPQVPVGLETLVMAMLETEREQRPSSAQQVLNALAFALAERRRIVPAIVEAIALPAVDAEATMSASGSVPLTELLKTWGGQEPSGAADRLGASIDPVSNSPPAAPSDAQLLVADTGLVDDDDLMPLEASLENFVPQPAALVPPAPTVAQPKHEPVQPIIPLAEVRPPMASAPALAAAAQALLNPTLSADNADDALRVAFSGGGGAFLSGGPASQQLSAPQTPASPEVALSDRLVVDASLAPTASTVLEPVVTDVALQDSAEPTPSAVQLDLAKAEAPIELVAVVPPRRAWLIPAAVAGVVVLAILLVSLIALGGGGAEVVVDVPTGDSVAAVVAPVPAPPADAPAAPVPPVEPAPLAPAGVAAAEPALAVPVPAAAADDAPDAVLELGADELLAPSAKGAKAKKMISVRGPPRIAWYDHGKLLGKGTTTVSLPANAKTVVAVDLDRGVRSVIPLTAKPVDYASLPRGKLSIVTNAIAEVRLGRLLLGTTPLPPVDVVAGTYIVKLVNKKRVETRTIKVKAGTTLRVAVDFSKK